LVRRYLKTDDLCTYFGNLNQVEFHTPEDLFQKALALYDNYSTPKAAAIFASGCQPNPSVVPIGEPWRDEEDTEPKPVPAEVDHADAKPVGDGSDQDEGKDGPEEREGVVPVEDEEFEGDHTLMRSSLLMYEALVSKEVAQAVAEGDVGRVYEGIKVCRQLSPNLSILMECSSCCSRSRAPRTTSIPATCLT